MGKERNKSNVKYLGIKLQNCEKSAKHNPKSTAQKNCRTVKSTAKSGCRTANMKSTAQKNEDITDIDAINYI